MTKWARMRKRKEKERDEALKSKSEGKEVKLTEPEKISNNVQYSQEIEKLESVKMPKPNYNNHLISKKIFFEHLSVVFIFSVLTVILTFPVILDFASEAAGLEDCYDQCHMMWRFWCRDWWNPSLLYHIYWIFTNTIRRLCCCLEHCLVFGLSFWWLWMLFTCK